MIEISEKFIEYVDMLYMIENCLISACQKEKNYNELKASLPCLLFCVVLKQYLIKAHLQFSGSHDSIIHDVGLVH